jgi:hypothetical protein
MLYEKLVHYFLFRQIVFRLQSCFPNYTLIQVKATCEYFRQHLQKSTETLTAICFVIAPFEATFLLWGKVVHDLK